MGSVSEWTARLAPAAFVLKAIIVSLSGISALMIFILVRRWLRSRFFARREQQILEIRTKWQELISGQMPPDAWRFDPLACEVLETMLLDNIEVSSVEELPRLVDCLRRSGLIDRRIHEARETKGWQRWRALVALGRTRAIEAIPALAEALDSADMETRIAAVRGIGKLAIPAAATTLLERFSDGRLLVPAAVLKNAVLNCCRDEPALLLHYVIHGTQPWRELLARVLAEIADSSMAGDLVVLAGDPSAEVRSAAARGLQHCNPHMAVPPLAQLAGDAEWFVRLRAVVSLGSMPGSDARSVVIRALTDRNRIVRQRAAWALMNSGVSIVRILRMVADYSDNYALQAVVAELERSGRYAAAVHDVELAGGLDADRLLAALESALARLRLQPSRETELHKAGVA